MPEKPLPFFAPDGFVQGWINYADRYSVFEQDYRIVIQVKFASLQASAAILDTGAPWCILGPEDADDLDFDYRVDYVQRTRMVIRGMSYNGWLCRIPVTITANEGEGITVDATTFIPGISSGITWSNPNFVGLKGFLDRIRFAIDPGVNRFYFGAIR